MVFCRVILEHAIFDRLKARGKLPYNIDPDKIPPFKALIIEAKKINLLDKQSLAKVELVKDEVDLLLHKKEPVPVDAGKAYHCIRDTFYILTQIFKPF
jgi:hypothetical protein